MIWLFISIYAIGYIWSFRWIGRSMMKDLPKPDGGDIAMMAFADLYFSIFWPFLALYLVTARIGRAVGRRLGGWDSTGALLFGESRDDKLRRRESAVAQREQDIARLEALTEM